MLITAKIPAGRSGIPNPVDIHIGKRIRLRRKILKMSQEQFADLLGLTFQQIQKYERGTNRVSGSRLYDIANILQTSVQFFYENMSNEVASQSPRLRAGLGESTLPSFESDPMSKSETLELIHNFYNIKDDGVREKIMELCKLLAVEQGRPGVDS